MTTDPWRRAVAVTIGLLAGLLGGAHDATAQPAPTDRFVVSVDVGWRPASRTFGSTRVFPVYAELGNFQASYAIEKGGAIGGGVSFRLSSRKPPGCSLASGFRRSLGLQTGGSVPGLALGLSVPGDVGPGPYSFRISISDSGSTRAPFNRRVQCRCGPVTRPVAPA